MNSVISFQFYETLAVDSTLNSVNNQNNTETSKCNSMGNLEHTFIDDEITSNTDSTTVTGVGTSSSINVSLNLNSKVNQVRLSKSELNQRNRHLLDRSVQAIGLRGKSL